MTANPKICTVASVVDFYNNMNKSRFVLGDGWRKYHITNDWASVCSGFHLSKLKNIFLRRFAGLQMISRKTFTPEKQNALDFL